MGRMHNPGKGISQSCLPYRRSVPTWLKTTSADVEEHIERLARKGLRPSQIGVILRDSHGVAQDLYHLIKKAVNIRKHLERFRKDIDGKYRLILVESRIHRLARYYKTKRQLAPTWKYESATASALVS
ncbi:40S ribosomal protein S13 [Aphelenchoides fujianensis]|nr:40S ribosomal protein S13 [Aphelenchoides fujianensis]